MRTELSAAEVVAWLRHQAKTFADMADTIETTLSLGFPPQSQSNLPVTNQPVASRPVAPQESTGSLVQEIKKIMDGRSRRLSDIAFALGRTEENIEPLLTQENGFVKADRGWYKVRTDENVQVNGQPMLAGCEEN